MKKLVLLFFIVFSLMAIFVAKVSASDTYDYSKVLYTCEDNSAITIDLVTGDTVNYVTSEDNWLAKYEWMNVSEGIIKITYKQTFIGYFKLDIESKKCKLLTDYVEPEPEEIQAKQEISEISDGISDSVKRIIEWVFGILAMLGVSWGTIATFLAWINKKEASANKSLKAYIKKCQEQTDTIDTQNIKINDLLSLCGDLTIKVYDLTQELNKSNEEKAKSKEEIDNIVKGVLTDGTNSSNEEKEQ